MVSVKVLPMLMNINQLIYAVEQDGELFAKYIEPFILKRIPGELPLFSENPQRALASTPKGINLLWTRRSIRDTSCYSFVPF